MKRRGYGSHPAASSMAYMIWFQASGSPGMHQCVQSMPSRPGPPYTDGCASILSCDSDVMSSSDTAVVAIDPSTPRTTTCSGSSPAPLPSAVDVTSCSGASDDGFDEEDIPEAPGVAGLGHVVVEGGPVVEVVGGLLDLDILAIEGGILDLNVTIEGAEDVPEPENSSGNDVDQDNLPSDPYRTVQNKNSIGKVMFLAALARPRYNEHGDETFLGKVGIFPFVKEEPAAKNSRNRPRETLITKSVVVNRDVMRDYLINKALPAIQANWQEKDAEKTIFIQQDNARTHVSPTDPEFCATMEESGLDIHLIHQPANSPDMNILDLDQRSPRTIQELIADVEKEYNEYEVSKHFFYRFIVQSYLVVASWDIICSGHNLHASNLLLLATRIFHADHQFLVSHIVSGGTSSSPS
ncbi:hypothetical protein E2562_012841 [Oryza meyeriana var. granulata]|uniref:Transposase n=1 Tax=Oryza meyeriana var. granulata TaxID=110450 RepID=A0A6G1CPL5_9ORYZ|nr:hypothetical protein E2562_012841 [Oryza meyeriana var. granulata]